MYLFNGRLVAVIKDYCKVAAVHAVAALAKNGGFVIGEDMDYTTAIAIGVIAIVFGITVAVVGMVLIMLTLV